jgi:hypothetical protein
VENPFRSDSSTWEGAIHPEALRSGEAIGGAIPDPKSPADLLAAERSHTEKPPILTAMNPLTSFRQRIVKRAT